MNTYPRQLAPNFWVLGDRYTNLYLARGRDASALLEAGISAGVDQVIQQLEAQDVSPDYVVVPHPHPDHVTGLPGLRARYPSAQVVAGQGAPEFLNHPRVASAAVTEDRHLWAFYTAVGIKPGRPPLNEPPSLDGCRVVADGDAVDLGGMTIRFHAVGGHAPGQLAVHVPEVRALVVSDALGFLFPRRGAFPVFFTSYPEHQETLERLEGLGARIVCPAHMGPLLGEDAREAFRATREAARRLAERVWANQDRLEPFAEELFREVYVDEFMMYTETNIRNCVQLLIRRSLETEPGASPSAPPKLSCCKGDTI